LRAGAIVVREEPRELRRVASREPEYAAFNTRVYAFGVNLTPDFGKAPEVGGT